MATVIEGQHVVYVDPKGQERDALVTAVWGEREFDVLSPPSINLVIIDLNDGARDHYGQQRVHATSVVHEKNQAAPGNFWRLP